MLEHYPDVDALAVIGYLWLVFCAAAIAGAVVLVVRAVASADFYVYASTPTSPAYFPVPSSAA
ncbi:hypothetical protein [Flaviflexus equikiangi]|uniref:hypothetical protein n=1 Tax=Flaviflexus equikiangi TaxID=2758573 RepID=UPI0015F595CF|nr:hypothetical protein [Flaviflexus equikiangi]